MNASLLRKLTLESRLREAVCHFSDIAWREHPDYRPSWALHRILQWPFLAADHRQRAFIALAVAWRYGGTEEMADYRPLLEPAQARRAKVLGLALRLAYTLSAGTVEVLRPSYLYWSEGRPQLHLPEDGPDGLVCDSEGNLWVAVRDATRPGIYAYTPDGEEKGIIPTTIPTNVHFGRGENSDYLYITADNSLYGMKVGKQGHHLQ